MLIAAAVVLVAGLGAWAAVARRDGSEGARRVARPAAPSVGTPVPEGDASASTVRRALERATLGGLPVLALFERSSIPVHGIAVPGRDAIAVWDRLRSGSGASGRWPVVLGDGWATRAHADAARATVDPPEAIVRRAGAVDLDGWIARRLVESGVDGADPGRGPEEADAARAADEASPGREGDDASAREERQRLERFRVVRDAQLDVPLPMVAIAMLPIRDPVEAPAWLAFGNWRRCPEPTIHVAMLARWQARWGAEVVAIGADTIELRVTRPPQDLESALAVTREQVAYAPALLAGGARTLRALAAARVGASVWSFRWARGEARPRSLDLTATE